MFDLPQKRSPTPPPRCPSPACCEGSKVRLRSPSADGEAATSGFSQGGIHLFFQLILVHIYWQSSFIFVSLRFFFFFFFLSFIPKLVSVLY